MSSEVETSLIIRKKRIARDSSTALRYARNDSEGASSGEPVVGRSVAELRPPVLHSTGKMPACLTGKMPVLRSHRNRCGAFQFSPTHPRAFYSTQNCFPNTVAQHRSVNQAHRNNSPGLKHVLTFQDTGERRKDHVCSKKDYDKWQKIAPGPKGQ